MAARVVTFTVQIGSGGYAIARGVAEHLGFKYYDWEVTSEAAARAGVSPEVVAAAERIPSFLERIMQRLVSVSTVSGEDGVAIVDPPPALFASALQGLNSDDYRQFMDRVVGELAEQGRAVIVGHAAQAVLRDTPGVFKVLLYASNDVRAARLAREQGLALDAADQMIRTSDREREELFSRAYKIRWLNASNYDLCIRTDRVPPEFAIDTVTAAARPETLAPE